MFLRFTNFYWHFIQDFSRIATLLTSMLKTTVIDLARSNPVAVSENIINIVISNSKIDRAKVGTKTARFKS